MCMFIYSILLSSKCEKHLSDTLNSTWQKERRCQVGHIHTFTGWATAATWLKLSSSLIMSTEHCFKQSCCKVIELFFIISIILELFFLFCCKDFFRHRLITMPTLTEAHSLQAHENLIALLQRRGTLLSCQPCTTLMSAPLLQYNSLIAMEGPADLTRVTAEW